MMDHPFEIGGRYRNRKGEYEVLAIEANPAWRARYENLVLHYSSGGKDGKSTVNTNIGYYTADLAGMVNIGEGKTARSSLIQSYSRLGYAKVPGKE